MRYIALLRGINISGKNKISMPELKASLTKKGFADVKTYLNSGNVLFSDEDPDVVKLAEGIRAIIFEIFKLEIPVFVISQDELKELLSKAPSWSFDRKLYAKTNWWKKTATPGIGEMITIRTANTLRKIAEM